MTTELDASDWITTRDLGTTARWRRGRASAATDQPGLLLLVFPHAAGLHDPQAAIDWRAAQCHSQSLHAGNQGLWSPAPRKPDECDPGIRRRIEEQWVAELHVEGDETPALVAAHLDEFSVDGARQSLLRDRGDVMPRGPQRLAVAPSDVLVKLDLQESRTIGTST